MSEKKQVETEYLNDQMQHLSDGALDSSTASKEDSEFAAKKMNRFDSYFQNIENNHEPWQVFICLLIGIVVASFLTVFLLTVLKGALLLKVFLILSSFFLVMGATTSLFYRIIFKKQISILAVYVWLFMFAVVG